jgi:hypothetical protein
MSDQYAHSSRTGVVGELLAQGRFADAWFTGNERADAVSVQRSFRGCAQCGKLRVAANEFAQSRLQRVGETGDCVRAPGAEQLGLLRLGEPKSGGQPLQRVRLRCLPSATLEVGDAAATEAAAFGELLLGQSDVGAKCTQERTKSLRRVCLPHTRLLL